MGVWLGRVWVVGWAKGMWLKRTVVLSRTYTHPHVWTCTECANVPTTCVCASEPLPHAAKMGFRGWEEPIAAYASKQANFLWAPTNDGQAFKPLLEAGWP